jgi:NhaP-type Na+/H+ or K+/H+ antiporter
VLYNIFLTFSAIGAPNIIAVDVVAGVGSFFVISLGGTLIGMMFAVLVAFSTRYLSKSRILKEIIFYSWTQNVAVLSPFLVFIIPYIAYLFADMCSVSPILA